MLRNKKIPTTLLFFFQSKPHLNHLKLILHYNKKKTTLVAEFRVYIHYFHCVDTFLRILNHAPHYYCNFRTFPVATIPA